MDLVASPSLPPGWAEAHLSDFCHIVQGQSPPGDTYNTTGEGVPFFQGKSEFGPLYATPRKWCSAPTKMAARDDILISIRAPVGPTNLCPEAACIGRGLAAIRPQGGVPIRYVLYGIHATEEKLAEKATGTTFEAISGDALRTHRLTLAPLPEQHRIVAEIERQFSLLDAGIANLKRVQANLKRYRAAVLQAACTGQLVPTEAELAEADGRPYEPAAMLLTRILAERRARWEAEQLAKMEAQGKLPLSGAWKAKYQEPAAPDIDGLPELPEGWGWAGLEQLLGLLRNGSSVVPDAAVGLAMLRISALRPLKVFLDDVRFVSDAKAKDCKEFYLTEGDLLFTRYNGNPDFVGVCGAVRVLPRPTVHPDKLIRGEVVHGLVSPLYLEAVLNAGASRHFIRLRVKTTAGQAGVSGSDLKAVPVPLPPLAEQERIVAEVERRLSVVDNLEQVVKANLKRAERLRQAVLKEAFAGRLVPQDPANEPASVLLERIKAEREAQAKAPAKSKVVAKKQRHHEQTDKAPRSLFDAEPFPEVEAISAGH